MSKNKHLVNAVKTAQLIPHAKTASDKNLMIAHWAKNMKKAIRTTKSIVPKKPTVRPLLDQECEVA